MTKTVRMIQARTVLHAVVGSSVLLTQAATSGNGDSVRELADGSQDFLDD